MQYLGGKHRQGKKIAETVTDGIQPNSLYVEPFCGAMGSAHRVAEVSLERGLGLQILLSDVQPALIHMWEALLYEAWEPPQSVSEGLYNELKAKQDAGDPRTAFVGYGLAFAGKYFGTYARRSRGETDPKIYARLASNSVKRRSKPLIEAEASVLVANYEEYEGSQDATFYLDPPYKGRTKQNSKLTFDHDKFWEFARCLSKKNRVFVSEFQIPNDFVVVHNFGDTVVRHYAGQGTDGTQEVLVVHKSRRDLFPNKALDKEAEILL